MPNQQVSHVSHQMSLVLLSFGNLSTCLRRRSIVHNSRETWDWGRKIWGHTHHDSHGLFCSPVSGFPTIMSRRRQLACAFCSGPLYLGCTSTAAVLCRGKVRPASQLHLFKNSWAHLKQHWKAMKITLLQPIIVLGGLSWNKKLS